MQIVTVSLPGPIDVPASVEMFRRSGDDLIDRWDGTVLVRTIPVGGPSVAFAATVSGTMDTPQLDVSVEDPGVAAQVGTVLSDMFVGAPADFPALLRSDAIIAALDTRFPGLRPVLQPNLLAALIRSISAQQVNLRWAATTRRRLAEAFGTRHEVAGFTVYSFDAPRLATATVADIRALQFTTRKAEYIIGVAEAIASGRLDLGKLRALPDEEVIARLTALRGIGRWTAEWMLARTLGRPVVVAGDLGVRKAVGRAYLGTALPSEQQVRAATAHWGTSATVAQTLLLRGSALQAT